MYTLIDHQELTGTASSITFNNIPQIYTDLYLVVSSCTESSSLADYMKVVFNSDNSNYFATNLMGVGSSTSSSTWGYGTIGLGNGSGATAGTYSSQAVSIPNYTSSTTKTYSVDSVSENNASTAIQNLVAGRWSNNSPITSIAISSDYGYNLKPGSSATLYGINRTSAIGKPKAIGGNITYANGYWVHTFTGSGTFTTQQALEIDALVVAGGGGSGFHIPGGGGAGGALVLSGATVARGAYSVLVGSGGPAGSTEGSPQGTAGSNSAFLSSTSIGGGYGGTRQLNPASGGNGGSGGGGGGGGNGNPVTGGSGTSGQGNSGGNGYNYPDGRAAGGGGGGATAAGASGSFGAGGNGGAGLLWNGSYYAGGGGGSSGNSAGAGGLGGGGNGSLFQPGLSPQSGAANTGGGAGGGEYGASGGSGVVIIRYRAD